MIARLRRDDDAGGVDRGMAGHAFETARDGEELFHLRSFCSISRNRDSPGAPCRGSCPALAESAWQPCRLPRRSTRARGRRPDDGLGFIVPNVMICETFSRPYFRDVLNHLAAPTLAEVDVDIWQRYTFRVEETLEDEVVIDRVDVGDAQAPRRRGCRRPSHGPADRNALLAGEADEVPGDQEVPGPIFLIIASS